MVVDIDTETEVAFDELVAALPDVPLEFADTGGFDSDDAAYAEVVEAIIRDEIGHGEGANLVIARNYRATVADWDADRALTVLRRLLERERGAYWTYCFFTGDRYLVGASPERHVSVHGGEVRMNPISGTFRLPKVPGADVKQQLLDFLADEKEIYELFMVVDEELKMMCDICNEGGQVLGPFLKPMTHLVHTEYLLAGRTARDVREVLRDTMYAATVTGSPVENACRLIREYEPEGRGYYGAALALLGRDAAGAPTADSPIVIRTADVDLEGRLKVTAGATLVRDSDPAYEVAETHAKAGGILSAFGLVPPATAPAGGTAALDPGRGRPHRAQLPQPAAVAVLAHRPGGRRAGRRAAGEVGGDPRRRGRLREHAAPRPRRPRDDLVGGPARGLPARRARRPRPGDRRARGRATRATATTRRSRTSGPRSTSCSRAGQPFLAVCLGHQTLCQRLGIPLAFKDIVFQGTQSPVGIDGRVERVGFYNTFVGRTDGATALADGVRVEADEATGDIHVVAGPHFRGIQFHAESILTENGFDLIHALVRDLLDPSRS